MPSTTARVASASSTLMPWGRTNAAVVACPAAFTNAAAARLMASASTSPALPKPVATTVPPSSASKARASPSFPSKPCLFRNAMSSSMPAAAADLRPVNMGTPTACTLPGSCPAGAAVKLIAMALVLLLLRLVRCAARQRVPFLLPTAHGPQQAGEPVEVGHHLRSVGRHADDQALGPPDHSAGIVTQ